MAVEMKGYTEVGLAEICDKLSKARAEAFLEYISEENDFGVDTTLFLSEDKTHLIVKPNGVELVEGLNNLKIPLK